MINRLKNIFLLMPLFAGLLWFQGCKHDDFDEPPLAETPVGTVMTIQELRDMHEGEPIEFEDDYSVYANITMDDKSGNIYRSAFAQDETAAINLRLQAPGGVYQGDSVRIHLKGTTLSSYQQMLQLDNVNVDKNIVKEGTNILVEPTTMNITEIGPENQGQLIRLEEVQFINDHVGLPFADSDNLLALNRTLEDCDGNRIIVRTSGYSNFADDPVPEGNGTLIAVVSQHQNDIQLYIRDIDEMSLDGERCPVPGDDYDLITFAELRDNYHDGDTGIPPNTRVEGVVISDEENSNHPGQNLFMMDESGEGMVIRFQDGVFHDFPMGTSLRVIVSNMQVSEYRGLLQIENVPIGNAHSLGMEELPEPNQATVQEVIDNIDTYQSTLVTIENATIAGGTTFDGELTVTDDTGSIAMYTHSWASFADNQVPEGNVTITAIAAVHFDPQLMIRNLNDIIEE